MITVTVTENSIESRGHAKEHLICNTVSTLMWGYVTCLDASNGRVTNEEDEGYQRVSFIPSYCCNAIHRGYQRCLKELAEAYPEEIAYRVG